MVRVRVRVRGKLEWELGLRVISGSSSHENSHNDAQQRSNRFHTNSKIAYLLTGRRGGVCKGRSLVFGGGRCLCIWLESTGLGGRCVCTLARQTPRFVLFSSEGRRPGLTPRPGELQMRRRGRSDTCDWSLTICPHTLHETRDYRVILEVAASTQNH